jgi:hypothetical protein
MESAIHFCLLRNEAWVLLFRVLDPYWLVSMRIPIRIQIQPVVSIRIRIQGAKPMRIHGDLDPDPSQIRLCRQNRLDLYMKNLLYVGNMP